MKLRFFLVPLILAFYGSTVSLGQSSQRTRADFDKAAAETRALFEVQQLLESIYPDLQESNLAVALSVADSRVFASFSEPVDPTKMRPGFAKAVPSIGTTKPREQDPLAEPLLAASIRFDARGLLQDLAADGRVVNSAKNRLLQSALRQHSTWTAGDVAAWLPTLDSKTPTEVMDASTSRMASWSRYLGEAARSTTPELQLTETLNKTRFANDAPKRAVYAASVSARASDGRLLNYEFQYEPIGGGLVQVRRK